MYTVFGPIVTGVGNVTCCHPEPVSEVNVACARTAPEVEYSRPMCVPLSLPLWSFQKRTPVTWPATSDRNFTPRVTGPSLVGRSVGAPVVQIDFVPAVEVPAVNKTSTQ